MPDRNRPVTPIICVWVNGWPPRLGRGSWEFDSLHADRHPGDPEGWRHALQASPRGSVTRILHGVSRDLGSAGTPNPGSRVQFLGAVRRAPLNGRQSVPKTEVVADGPRGSIPPLSSARAECAGLSHIRNVPSATRLARASARSTSSEVATLSRWRGGGSTRTGHDTSRWSTRQGCRLFTAEDGVQLPDGIPMPPPVDLAPTLRTWVAEVRFLPGVRRVMRAGARCCLENSRHRGV